MRTTSESSPSERRSGAERRQRGKRAAETLHLVVQRMADGVLVVDRDRVIHFANPAAAALFGRAEHELIGQPLGFSVLAGDETEIELLRPDGEQMTVEVRAVEYDWQDRPAILLSLRDVTDRKCLEQERLARARAEAASRAKSDFLMLMSHELRTPLNAVLGYAELLMVDDPRHALDAEQRSRVVRILASGRHLRDLVAEMLDLAEAGEGRLTVEHASAPATRPAKLALEDVGAAARSQGIHVVATCADEQLMFAGDEARVRQVLAILLDNAIKFTPRGGSVQLECDRVTMAPPGSPASDAGPWVRWRVVDSGIGIPADQLASIFEPFAQVDGGHTREKDGPGLGLTIGRSLARLMKGDLTVESQQGRGSTFTLWLPAA